MSESSGGVALVTVGQYGTCPLCHDEPGPVTHACPWHLDQAACSYHAPLLVCQRCGGELHSIGSRMVLPRPLDEYRANLERMRGVDMFFHNRLLGEKPGPRKPQPPALRSPQRHGKKVKRGGKGKRGR